jgi:hypothetical protein
MRKYCGREFLLAVTVILFSISATLPAFAGPVDDLAAAAKAYDDAVKAAKACCAPSALLKQKLKRLYAAQNALADAQTPWPGDPAPAAGAVDKAQTELDGATKDINEYAENHGANTTKNCFTDIFAALQKERNALKGQWKDIVTYKTGPAFNSNTDYGKALQIKSGSTAAILADRAIPGVNVAAYADTATVDYAQNFLLPDDSEKCPMPHETVSLPGGYPAGGLFIQGGVGGAWSVPAFPAGPSGSGSSATFNAAAGYRLPSPDHTSWGSLSFGVETYTGNESFPPPFDDARVRPYFILTQFGEIGPNIHLPNGLTISPYAQFGIAEAYMHVSDAAGSATQWTVGPLVGGGFDWRLTPSLLFDVNAHVSFLSQKTYQTGPVALQLNEQATSVTAGFIWEFGQTPQLGTPSAPMAVKALPPK